MAGLNLEKCREHETTDARLASEIARNLSYAGLALIWIYRSSQNVIPIHLIPPALLFIFFFLFDLGQYVYKANYWAKFYRQKEQELATDDPNAPFDEDAEFTVPDSFHKTVDDLYNCKIGFLIAAYIWIFIALAMTYFNPKAAG